VLVEASALVGRRDEVVAIEHALSGLAAGRSGVVEIVGEPGIGKTRLIAEACARAESAHVLPLAGRAAEFERDAPFGVFVDALDDYLGTVNPRRIERLGPDVTREVAQIFPALADFADGGSMSPGERFRSHRAVRLLLDALAGPAPLLLALDDLHWADQASLELVSYLLRKRGRAPVLLVVAYRSGQAPRLLRAALASAARDGDHELIEPGPLTVAEAGELVGTRVQDDVYRESGGNPFYLEQLTRAAQRGGVPTTVADALDGEVDALGEDARATLLAAAVAGEPFDPGVVAAVARLDEPTTLAALDDLLAADLVRPTDVPLRFRFRHPIVRHALYERAGAGWRIGAHARAAAALEAAGASPTLRAHHVERSATAGDEDAIALLTAAARASVTRAPATAARWFDAAVRLLPDGDMRRLELLVPLAAALGAAGQLAAARDSLEELRALIPPELGAARARVTIIRAGVDNLLGDHGTANALLREALADQEDADPQTACDIKLALSTDRFFAGDWDGQYGWARPAYEGAVALDDKPRLAAAAAHLAGAAYLASRIDEANVLLDQATAIVDSVPDDQVAERLEALHWLGWCEEFMQRYDAAIGHLRRGLTIARATGHGHVMVGLLMSLASSLGWRGRLAEADEVADECFEIALLAGNDQFVNWALTGKSWIALQRGDVREAIRCGEQGAELGRGDPVSALAGCAHGEALIEAGEPAAGRAAILAAGGGPDQPQIEQAFRTRWYEPLTRAEIALGDLAAAERWARLAEDAAAVCRPLGGRQSEALRARAAVSLAGGDASAAADTALRAAESAATIGVPVEEATGRLLAGRALAVAGDLPAATAELESARVAFAAAGAERLRDAAARELRKLGRRVPRRGAARRASPGDALSVREREIAELVTLGRTNRQIAAELFLSEKTVETHLSHVFAKLGVGSRAAVAGALPAR
jgi:DNA-binding NarL/FixJ family response regulator